MRGPAILPRQPGVPELPTSRERFDELVLDVVTAIDRRWSDRLGLVEYAVEDAPRIPDDWESGNVPLSSLVRGTGPTATRLVLFRRPDRAPLRDPGRPRGDGAHGPRRAGGRAARDRRRGGRPPLPP